jgi:hypothetical protein
VVPPENLEFYCGRATSMMVCRPALGSTRHLAKAAHAAPEPWPVDRPAFRRVL